MSTSEISVLVEKKHDVVLDDVRKMVKKLMVPADEFSGVYTGGESHGSNFLYVSSDAILTLISKYNVVSRKRVIDRLMELEKQAVNFKRQPPESLSDSIFSTIGHKKPVAESKLQDALRTQQKSAASIIEFVEKHSDRRDARSFTQVCKLLGASEIEFFEFLKGSQIIYKSGGSWIPKAAHFKTHRFVKQPVVYDSCQIYIALLFKQKGIEWIAGKWTNYLYQA